MKLYAIVMGSLAIASGWAQQPQLAPAEFVVRKADEVDWSIDGRCLKYIELGQNKDPKEIGLYNFAKHDGKSLLKLGPGQRVESTAWLAGRPYLLVATEEEVANRKEPTVKKVIWLLDGNELAARALWTSECAKKGAPQIEFEASPTLTHALVTLRGKDSAYYVVTLGALGVTFSPDATRAAAEGNGFAGWSLDGTALFAQGATGTANFLSSFDLTSSDDASIALGEATITLSNEFQEQLDFKSLRLSISGLRFRPNLDMGQSVLECMPASGVLRPIKFKGYYEAPNGVPDDTKLAESAQSLIFQSSKGLTKSLWLAPNVDDPKKAVLVSTQVESAWRSPNGKVIAFTVNGVLFIRQLEKPNE